MNMLQSLSPTDLILDNGADVSIVSSMLTDSHFAESPVKIKGAGGVQMIVNKWGYLNEFFEVWSSDEAKANVLSFADVEDLNNFTYVTRKMFIVHLPNREITFVRREKLCG